MCVVVLETSMTLVMKYQYWVTYPRHYNPQFVYTFTPYFTAVYIVEPLVIKTIYVLNKEILQFLGLKSAVCNSERVIMACVR